MEAQELREKLTEYIRVADEKKIAAIYTLVEDEIENEYKWWEDEAFVKELKEQQEKIKSGEIICSTQEEANKKFEERINKHQLVNV